MSTRAAWLCPLDGVVVGGSSIFSHQEPQTCPSPSPGDGVVGGASVSSITLCRATSSPSNQNPSASYRETARGSLQSCYIARCSLTFPTRLLCAKYLTPTGSLKAFGDAMATGERREQSTTSTTEISNHLSHFQPRLQCTTAIGSPAARTQGTGHAAPHRPAPTPALGFSTWVLKPLIPARCAPSSPAAFSIPISLHKQ